ncbi:MAG: DHH family phosphoesterase [Candidatus Iainarchaeum archaeon]|uniref:DHH family phosphoesterase n=1 Tax=Candidatus Iainarchaeum sp. TaxID=3101447 RepID=A0A7T9DJ29_9ARCH|nr:MAG: DHH family phosphoesterase [Candidatus Diapherotrites archaeon]
MGGEMRSGELAEDRKAAVRTFLDTIESTAKTLNGLDSAVVVTHHDCDGMTSGGIMAQALKRAQIPVDTITLKQLYSEDIDRLKKMEKWLIFTDFGSSYINQLKEAVGEKFVVIDHHQKGNGLHDYHVNPMEFGLDGGVEISAGGISYLVAKAMSHKNMDLAALGVVGACGDMQDSRSSGLQGLNAEILLTDGIEAGVMHVKRDLRLYGRISRPLVQYLLFSTSPILPDLTANKDNCMRFLEGLGIELQHQDGRWRSYEDLNPEEKKVLSTALLMHLHQYNTPEWKLNELVGEVYTLTHEDSHSPLRDAKEFSTVLNACGRNGASSIGFQVCMGDRFEYYQKALGLLQEHRRNLAEGIQLMQTQGLQEYKNYYFFDAESKIKDSIVGIVAGMLYGSGSVKTDKPIVAFSRHEDGSIKVSARATSELVRNGVNLGLALRETCQSLGSTAEGGGHKIAAGCRLEENQKEQFLQEFDTKLGFQTNPSIQS